MNNNSKVKADEAPDEKKVWRGVSANQVFPPDELNMEVGIYFLAIEELQGAWVDGEWEEAGYDDDGNEIPRARRYVLKRFTDTGFAKNAFATYAGPRRYTK